jgi:uncharacterized protein with HEPN domain
MTLRDDRGRMEDILEYSREAVEMCRGRTRVDLDRDRMLNLALVRLLTVIGEAASRVSPAKRAETPKIAWPDVVGMRNRLIHAYDEVDLDVVWDVVQNDLPPLIAALSHILGSER